MLLQATTLNKNLILTFCSLEAERKKKQKKQQKIKKNLIAAKSSW